MHKSKMLTANLILCILWDWQNESEDISLDYKSKWAHTWRQLVTSSREANLSKHIYVFILYQVWEH